MDRQRQPRTSLDSTGEVLHPAAAFAEGGTVGRAIAVLIVAGWATVAQATTYNYSGLLYSSGSIMNFTPPCAVGPCANYTGGMSIRGSFTTSSPLPPNLAPFTEISSQVTSFRFTDGINVYSSGDPDVRRFQFGVGTDSSGNIVEPGGTFIALQLWQTGARPHTTSDRIAFLIIGGMTDSAWNNSSCPDVNAGASLSGDTDFCNINGGTDAASSNASGGPGIPLFGTWSIDRAAAPALSIESMVLLFALLLAGGGWRLHRKRSA